MAFAPKAGCPLCSIVSSAVHDPLISPRSPTSVRETDQPKILWRDDNFTVYREKANPVSSAGHVIIAFNLHVPSIYTLSSSDLPLLVNLKSLATRFLNSMLPLSSPATSPTGATPLHLTSSNFRIGFITPPFRDGKIPVTDHLHAHAYIMPADLMGWWRGVAYGPLAWYAIDDLIAEIRESTSNNRVKSGYDNRRVAPIDFVPSAGSRTGTASGIETTVQGLGRPDAELEAGEASPLSLSPQISPSSLNLSPPLRV
ncbi:uncharacterized protein EV420DRAFT_1513663 [Desarmillaria tabescens]|uniref:HIT domain-containing protein n=1 Tax=Armillaria tabescens TaxID=1929756 RepID=A0AA39NGM1_ARMTA|nr:uncharacterized protein EV420DRAFT_1513663 [Desarmillaria tabescens]KAK0465277.1 hypothetical protein EV420DRAFT_1513663 [Desarmillaria tabescens]